MLAHNLKDMLTLVPSLGEHIKEANFEEDFPLDNKDGAVASSLRCEYLIKVAKKIVNPEKVELVKKAASLYGVKDTVDSLTAELDSALVLQKQAGLAKAMTLPKDVYMANLEGSATGSADLEKLAEQAQEAFELYPEAAAQSSVAKTYACKGYFHKAAAVASLEARARATGNQMFEKVAEIVDRSMSDGFTEKDVVDVSRFVTALDKKAGLSMKGFNFYKETQLFKEAAIRSILLVKLAGKQVPYESIHKFGMERIASVLGSDVAKEMTSDPAYNKQVLESLPMDSQRTLANFVGKC